jgi:hypothetical protein
LEFVVYPWTFEQDAYPSVRDAATYQRGAKISDIEFSVQVGKTGVETKTQVGVLHNIAEKVNYSFGQVPQREGDIITYAGGLFKSDTITALQGFKRNVDSTTYPLLELVGREIIHFNKKNYNKLSGTIKNLAKEPLRFDKVFIYKGKNYLPFACSLDVISNTMNITTMQEVEPYMTYSFVEIKSELVTGGGATISGGNNTALQYSAEVGNAKRISELNNASESEKREAYVIIDNANWPESKKVPFFDIVGLNEAQVGAYLTENKYATQSWVEGVTKPIATSVSNLSGRVDLAEETIKSHSESIELNTNDIAANAQAISNNATNITKVTEKVTNLEKMWSLKDGKLFTDYSIVVKGGGSFGQGAESGGGSAGGLGQIIIRNQAGQEYKTDANGVVVIPTYLTSTALDDYATQQWVEGQKYLKSIPAEYITENELTAKGYALSSDLTKVGDRVTTLEGNFNGAVAKEAAKVSYALTFGNKTYDGSAAQSILASDLDAVTLSGEQIITGAKTFSSLITANSGIKIPHTASLKIGDITLIEDDGALKVLGNLVVTGGGAFGQAATTGGGGGEGFSKIIIQTEGGQSYTTNDAGVVTIPNYITSAALNGYATETFVNNRVNALINGAPAAYDTLKEIADVLAGNVNSIGDIITTLSTKADKATTLAGYGITDAKIASGVITLGANTIKPLTSHQTIYALTINNSAGIAQVTYTPNSKAASLTLTKAMVGLSNVENTALSTWAGSSKITTLGTITSGTWNGTKIANGYLANSSMTIAGTSVSLGGSISVATLQSNLGLKALAYKDYLEASDIPDISATYVTVGTSQTISGAKTFSASIAANGGIVIPSTKSLKIGEVELTWDGKALRINKSLVVLGGGAFGEGATSGGGTSGGLGSVIIKTEGGIEYKTNANGVVTVPNWITASALNDYATQSWVEGKKYLTAIPSEYVTDSELSTTLGGYQTKITSSNKIAYSNVSGTPSLATVATSGKYSDLSGVPTSLPASDVYAWAKAATKPTYTASEVGALSISGGTIDGNLGLTGYINTKSHYFFVRNNDNADWVVTNKNWSAEYTLIHSGNIGSQSVASANKLLTSNGAFMVYQTSAGHLYVGDNIYSSGDTHILGNNIRLRYGTSASYGLILNSSGNVLIGTTTDNGAKLQVNGSIHTKGVLLPNYTAIQSYLTDGTLVNLMYMNDANLLRIGNSSHKTAIVSAYVGIYTTNPAYTLDVNGTFNATTIYQNGQTLDKYYLPLSGGTITNDLTVNGYLSSGKNYIRLSSYYLIAGTNWRVTDASWQNEYTLIHSGNIGSYNAGSATKLQDNTAYTAWGQTFFENGKPKNVSGEMYDVGRVVFDNTRTYGIYKGNVFSQGLAETDLVIYSPKTILGWGSTNVLIGTTTDNGYKLYVNGTSYFSDSLYVNGNITATAKGTFSDIEAKSLSKHDSGTGYYIGGRNYGLGVTDGGCLVYAYGNTPISFYTYGSERMRISGNGDVSMYGNLTVTGGGAFGSDIRYKAISNYTDIDLATISNAPLFNYKWTDREDSKEYLGTSAQYWLNTAFGNAVNTDNPNFYHLDYGALGVGLAIATARKVVDHEERIATLEKENKELKEKLKKYETLWHN